MVEARLRRLGFGMGGGRRLRLVDRLCSFLEGRPGGTSLRIGGGPYESARNLSSVEEESRCTLSLEKDVKDVSGSSGSSLEAESSILWRSRTLEEA